MNYIFLRLSIVSLILFILLLVRMILFILEGDFEVDLLLAVTTPRINDVADIIGYCTLLLVSMGATVEDIQKLMD